MSSRKAGCLLRTSWNDVSSCLLFCATFIGCPHAWKKWKIGENYIKCQKGHLVCLLVSLWWLWSSLSLSCNLYIYVRVILSHWMSCVICGVVGPQLFLKPWSKDIQHLCFTENNTLRCIKAVKTKTIYCGRLLNVCWYLPFVTYYGTAIYKTCVNPHRVMVICSITVKH